MRHKCMSFQPNNRFAHLDSGPVIQDREKSQGRTKIVYVQIDGRSETG